MGESMLFLVLLAGCVIYGIDRKRRERKGALRRAALWMEQSPAVPADMDAVQDWWRALADGKDGGVDDITWQDLDMDAIFTAMNHTMSNGINLSQRVDHAPLLIRQLFKDKFNRRIMIRHGRLHCPFIPASGLVHKTTVVNSNTLAYPFGNDLICPRVNQLKL